MTTPGYSIERGPDGLTERERITKRMLTAGKSRTDVATALGVSRERVRQLVKSLEAKGHEVPSQQYRRRTDATD